MEKNTPIEFEKPGTISDPLTALLRMGARKLIEAAIQAELAEFLHQFESRKTSEGKRGVIRNGYQPEREILTGIGAVSVRIPKVRSRTGEPVTFRSALVPPYVRKTKSLEAALPWLCLKGISTGEIFVLTLPPTSVCQCGGTNSEIFPGFFLGEDFSEFHDSLRDR